MELGGEEKIAYSFAIFGFLALCVLLVRGIFYSGIINNVSNEKNVEKDIQYQGSVRPTDDLDYFYQTGITKTKTLLQKVYSK